MNSPLKQNGIREFIKQHCIDIMGILETKLGYRKLMRILRNKFDGFMHVNNFGTHRAGGILILWNPSKVFLDVMEVHQQIIHCKALQDNILYLSCYFCLLFHTVVNRMPLWNNIMEFNTNFSSPWLILGDYNNVHKFDEKRNEVDVTSYEIKDLTNCYLHVGLMDVRSIGCYYTWTNGSIWRKIDRAMINDIWVQNGVYVVANFLASSCLSDHSPCIVSVHDRVWGGKNLSTCWNFNVRGTKQFILCKKLSKLKGALKELNNKYFEHILTGANEAKIELEATQLQLHNQPKNVNFQLLVAKLRKKAVGLCEAERSFYYQKAVPSIENNIICNGPLVSLEQSNALVWDISFEEIKEALFGIGDNKSLGSVGYTSCFFKSTWGCIEHDFVEAIMKFFSLGSIPKQINHAVIALVPKSTHAPSVEDYRSISCCNVIYKVITKILASRLRPILGDIVDQAQAAFIEGRNMTENIHLTQELMRQYNRKRVVPMPP
ncbi:uncharacterized protein LOC111412589 [Olea europaea var. sylvestris]|uniref:uncharacterized protein LOC111412589 n=1 Tax=Olea europaea var. sylvestris TaxID=158386 RepID=UPI000C1CF4D2|nr:uncharacterized protein LOC111412589 [Olea europaea var. sylvestris]